MPIHAIDPNHTWEYVPRACADDPADQRPVFVLRALTSRESLEIVDLLSEEQPRPGTISFVQTRYGLAGWRHFRTSGGKEIPFVSEGASRAYATDETLSAIPPQLLAELARAIQDRSILGETDAKN